MKCFYFIFKLGANVQEFIANRQCLLKCFNVFVPVSFLVFQILIRGFAYGGLSELDESNYFSCKMGSYFSLEAGRHGLKPTVLEEMLAGKQVYGPYVGLGFYTRSFDGQCSPSDLETALQVKLMVVFI